MAEESKPTGTPPDLSGRDSILGKIDAVGRAAANFVTFGYADKIDAYMNTKSEQLGGAVYDALHGGSSKPTPAQAAEAARAEAVSYQAKLQANKDIDTFDTRNNTASVAVGQAAGAVGAIMTPGAIGRLGAWTYAGAKTLLGIGGAGAAATAATTTTAGAAAAAPEAAAVATQATGIVARTTQAVKDGAKFAKANPADASIKVLAGAGKTVTNLSVPMMAAGAVVSAAGSVVPEGSSNADGPDGIDSGMVETGVAGATAAVSLKIAKEVANKRLKPVVWLADRFGDKLPAATEAAGKWARAGVDSVKYVSKSAWTGATTVAAYMGISMTQGEAISGAYTSATHDPDPTPAAQVAEAVRDKYGEIKDAGIKSDSGVARGATAFVTTLVEGMLPPVTAIAAKELAIIADPRTDLADPHMKKLVERHIFRDDPQLSDPATRLAAAHVVFSKQTDLSDARVQGIADRLRTLEADELAAQKLSDEDFNKRFAALDKRWNPVRTEIVRLNTAEEARLARAAQEQAASAGQPQAIPASLKTDGASPSHKFNVQAGNPAELAHTGGLTPQPAAPLPPLVAPATGVDTSALRVGLEKGDISPVEGRPVPAASPKMI